MITKKEINSKTEKTTGNIMNGEEYYFVSVGNYGFENKNGLHVCNENGDYITTINQALNKKEFVNFVYKYFKQN